MHVTREMKKIALARLEGEVLDWMRDHGETFPELADICHQTAVRIDEERTTL